MGARGKAERSEALCQHRRKQEERWPFGKRALIQARQRERPGGKARLAKGPPKGRERRTVARKAESLKPGGTRQPPKSPPCLQSRNPLCHQPLCNFTTATPPSKHPRLPLTNPAPSKHPRQTRLTKAPKSATVPTVTSAERLLRRHHRQHEEPGCPPGVPTVTSAERLLRHHNKLDITAHISDVPTVTSAERLLRP